MIMWLDKIFSGNENYMRELVYCSKRYTIEYFYVIVSCPWEGIARHWPGFGGVLGSCEHSTCAYDIGHLLVIRLDCAFSIQGDIS